MNKLALIVPCYNEEAVVAISCNTLRDKLNSMIDEKIIADDSFIAFIDDGSKDTTWTIIQAMTERFENIRGIKLSRNFGHQAAILSGLITTVDDADMFITIDADLQDDIAVLRDMVLAYNDGSQIVYGVRNNRSSDSFSKRFFATSFYKLMSTLGVKTIYNHADFRLMGSAVVRKLMEFKEVNLYIRGIVPLLGFTSTTIEYSRLKRFAGNTKYPFSKSLALALDGITSFSVKPLRIIFFTGILFFLLSVLVCIWVIFSFLSGNTVAGWSSLLLPLSFFAGIQMISLGVVGEYVGKIYLECKSRPRYIVEKVTGIAGKRF